MDTIDHISLSLAQSMRLELDMIANNVANANSSGFRAEKMKFSSFIHDRPDTEDKRSLNFIMPDGRYLEPQTGMVVKTDNLTDFVIQGDAWFAYQTQEGQLAFGKNGQLFLNQDGNLVTVNGDRLLDIGGEPIVIPPEEAPFLSLSAEGVLGGQGGVELGQVALADLPDPDQLTRISSGLFLADPGANIVPALQASVVQGYFEGSNVQPVIEMTRMMHVQASYDRAVKIMADQDEMKKGFLQRIGRIA